MISAGTDRKIALGFEETDEKPHFGCLLQYCTFKVGGEI
jgi:hypothetical protein